VVKFLRLSVFFRGEVPAFIGVLPW